MLVHALRGTPHRAVERRHRLQRSPARVRASLFPLSRRSRDVRELSRAFCENRRCCRRMVTRRHLVATPTCVVSLRRWTATPRQLGHRMQTRRHTRASHHTALWLHASGKPWNLLERCAMGTTAATAQEVCRACSRLPRQRSNLSWDLATRATSSAKRDERACNTL